MSTRTGYAADGPATAAAPRGVGRTTAVTSRAAALAALACAPAARAQAPSLASAPVRGVAVVVPRPAPAARDSLHAAAAPAPAPARGTPRTPAAAPDYKLLRFDESWRRPPAPGAGPLARLKHLPLAADDAVYLTLGGQLRWRGEDVSHYQLGAGAARRGSFGLWRTGLAADLHARPLFGVLGLRAFGELRDAVADGRELPGGARPQDTDRWDVQNLFVDVSAGAPDRVPRATLRAGRQELALGKERLVGPGDWANARRTFQGLRLDAAAGPAGALQLFRVRPVQLSVARPNHADTAAVLWGATLTRAAWAGATGQLLALRADQSPAAVPTAGGVLAGPQRRSTLGARLAGAVPGAARGWLALDLEGGAQRGALAGRRVAAWYAVGELTAAGKRLPLRPTFTLGYDRSSGDRDSTDRAVGTFVAPYPSAHAFDGYADVVGRQNLADARAVLTADVPVVGQLRAAEHTFARVSPQDGAYGKTGALLRAPGGDAARAVGQELDLTATRPLGAHLKLVAGYAHFTPGAFLRHAPATAHPLDWGFGGTTFTF